jgi:hypothetical protein
MASLTFQEIVFHRNPPSKFFAVKKGISSGSGSDSVQFSLVPEMLDPDRDAFRHGLRQRRHSSTCISAEGKESICKVSGLDESGHADVPNCVNMSIKGNRSGNMTYTFTIS